MGAYTRILVAVDGSGNSDPAYREAVRVAKAEQAYLRVIHVVGVIPAEPGAPKEKYDAYRSMIVSDAQEILDNAVKRASELDMEAEPQLVEISSSQYGKGVLSAAQDWPADLIVMGTHGRSGVTHLLVGSVAEEVVRHATIPVLLVRGTVQV